jgi:hypothetical protein
MYIPEKRKEKDADGVIFLFTVIIIFCFVFFVCVCGVLKKSCWDVNKNPWGYIVTLAINHRGRLRALFDMQPQYKHTYNDSGGRRCIFPIIFFFYSFNFFFFFSIFLHLTNGRLLSPVR